MMSKNWKLFFFSALLIIGFNSCKDPWEEHDKINDGITGDNLLQLINDTPDLSVFAEYVARSGWDTVIATAKTYTVWAPDNNAMGTVDETILNDETKLRQFIGNHICFTLYSYYDKQPEGKVKTFSGKTISLDYLNGTVEDANLSSPYDILASNGILHIIDKPLIPKMNVWDFIESTNLCPAYTGYLNSLTGILFNPDIATQTGVDPVTGKAVYDTATGLTWSNPVISNIRDLKNEDSVSTVFLITDDVFQQEYQKFRPYFNVKNDPTRSDSITDWNVCKDYFFRGEYTMNSPEDTLISLFNVKVPFNKFAVDSVFNASNGKVFILHDCPVSLPDKIQPIIIQGEDTTHYIVTSLTGQTGYTRERPLASGGYDFILDNHGANPGAIIFHVGKVVAAKYQFYIKAIDDFNYSYRYPNETDTIKERLGTIIAEVTDNGVMFSTYSPLTSGYIAVTDTSYENATDMPAGSPTFFNYQDLWIALVGSGSNTTLAVDYIKLVPVFE